MQRPISVECITAPVGRLVWKDVPTWFLVAENDHMIPVENQRFMAERMGATVKAHAVDHTPLVTAPEAVTSVLIEAVENARREL